MRSSVPTAGVVTASLLLATACGAQPASDAATRQNDIERRSEARTGVARPLPERVPATAPAMTAGEVPEELMARIRADLAARTAAGPATFKVVQAEAVTWNDGSLGCTRPGEYYTQAPVQGYRVVLSHRGQEYDYRIGDRGYFMLCPAVGPAPRQPVKPGAG